MRLLLLLAFILSAAIPHYGQSTVRADAGTGRNQVNQTDSNEVELKKMAVLADLQTLAVEASSLDKPLARSLAKAEIAAAAWTLDPAWSKQLLRAAYELTLPNEESLSEQSNKPTEASPPPANIDQASSTVRSRVLEIAGQDPALAKELAGLGAQRLEQRQAQASYAALASQALQRGDTATASQYVDQSIRADPTQMDPGFSIMQVASRDRAMADKLIIDYVGALRGVPLSTESAARTYVMLSHLVFPASAPPIEGLPQEVSPPGPAVMKAYVSFMLESLGRLEQIEPGSVQRFRPMLINVWPILRQYAPELTGAFYQLEALSRRAGEDATLPKGDIDSVYKDRYEKRVKDALDSDKPDQMTIYSAISKGDFAKARRMIDKLDDGPQKTQLAEAVNTKEAISLAATGDLSRAGQLARQLNEAVSIMRVYPVIVNKCVKEKDRTCAANFVYQAMKQLKEASSASSTPPAGLPASFMPTRQEFDPVAITLCKLAKTIASLDGMIALDVLDEAVEAANRSSIDTGQGRTGLETDAFKKLAVEDEARVYRAASNLKPRLMRIAALAALYQWKAQALVSSAKGAAPVKGANNR